MKSSRILRWFKYYFLIAAVLSGSPLTVSAGEMITLDLGNNYRITEKQNLRVRINGSYQGYLFKEYRGFLRQSPQSANLYKGEFYILSDMKRDSKLLSKAVDDIYPAEFYITPEGYVSVVDDFEMPLHRSFPAFSFDPVAPGDSWTASGTDNVYDSRGNFLEIPFLCSYVFRGEGEYQNRPVLIIDSQYALRYNHGSDSVRTEFEVIQGTRKAVIMLYTDEAGGVFINTRAEQEITYRNGVRESTSGFILTWYDDIHAEKSEEILEIITDSLKNDTEDPEGQGISVKKEDKGITLGLGNIHFLPDSPVILPEETARLDMLADILKKADESTFLVTGHTADVGSAESQMELSLLRAKTIVDEMVARGIQAKRFLYSGKGGDEPVSTNLTEEGRALNRRVEITILD